MPPKAPKTPAKTIVTRPPISTSSLLYFPEDAIEGFQDRIETGIDWTLLEQAMREHKRHCKKHDIPTFSFKHAFKRKLENSVFQLFLNENTDLTLKQLWELSYPITVWDNVRFGNEEAHICFDNNNCITDNVKQIIKKAVDFDDRSIIKKELKLVSNLRLIGAEMTQLDPTLKYYKQLNSLVLCGNFISTVDPVFLPPELQTLELQSNRIASIASFADGLPSSLVYLGLARNMLTSECHCDLPKLIHITVLDLSDNDIYDLTPVLDALVVHSKLRSLMLAGNPCSVCAAYAITTLARLPQLLWLDEREILPQDRSENPEPYEPHSDDLRSAYFTFTVFRIMSAPQPPKTEKGVTPAFHVELELPLLDSMRRQFLMYRRHESLLEIMPPNEDDWLPSIQHSSTDASKMEIEENESHESDIYNRMITKDPRIIPHYTVFESNKVQWNKMMNFLEPTVKIFCPDLRALRDTFRTEITARLVYTLTYPPAKPGKGDKKSLQSLRPVGDQYCVLATMKFHLLRPNWTQNQQHFHWDNSMNSEYALHWGDGDLSMLQYSQGPQKPVKGKSDVPDATRRQPPENLTCHFGIGIETIRSPN